MQTPIAQSLAIWLDIVRGQRYCVKSGAGGAVLAVGTQYHLISMDGRQPGGLVRIRRSKEMLFVETTIQSGNFPGCERTSQSDDQVNHGES
jgi:hypothetical protein